MPIHLNLYNDTELDRARGRAYELRSYAAELTELADSIDRKVAARALDEGDLADLAGRLRDAAADIEADIVALDEAISVYQDARAA